MVGGGKDDIESVDGNKMERGESVVREKGAGEKRREHGVGGSCTWQGRLMSNGS